MLSRPALVVCGLACLTASAGAGEPSSAGPVSIERVGADFTVTVSGPARLGVVLEMLCQRAEASCKLPAGMDASVQPRTIRGSWPEVVAELIKGSGMSFGATPPAPGRAAYLFVEPPAAPAAKTTADRSPSASAVRPAAAEEPPAAEPAAEEVVDEAAAPEPEPSAAAADPSTATLVTAAAAAATPGAAFAMTPFADANGNALMSRVSTPGAPAPSMAVLPYSDEAGNPLVTPITNEPLSLTPFAGPDGEPWPAPVPVPGQKLEYPMSPPAPPAPKPENQ